MVPETEGYPGGEHDERRNLAAPWTNSTAKELSGWWFSWMIDRRTSIFLWVVLPKPERYCIDASAILHQLFHDSASS
jgi:hypothetical protein